MANPSESEEFRGELIISYKDGEVIYAYDEITHGLYKFTLEQKEAALVLSPESIYRNRYDRIIGISKSGNEIVLVPAVLDSEWVFYDVEKETVRYDSPVKNKIYISETITIGTELFLLPADIHNPVMIVSLDDMTISRVYENWYRQNGSKTNDENWIWGASSQDGFIVFPITGSKCIGCWDNRKISVITLDISSPILSISMYKDKIWVLPMTGSCIYAADVEGNIIEQVNLPKTESEISAGSFFRIAAAEETVFLFPVHGEDIWVYQCKKNGFVRIKTEEEPLWGEMFTQHTAPYYDFIIESKKLYLLPLLYRCKSIDLDSLEVNSCGLKYGKNIDNNRYWRMIGDTQKNHIFREDRNNFKEFIQFASCVHEEHFAGRDSKIGKQIWGSMIEKI